MPRSLWFLALLVLATMTSQCAPIPPTNLPAGPPMLPEAALTTTDYQSFDRDRFPYTRFGKSEKPTQIIIAIHGISGAARDFNPVAEHLLPTRSDVIIYAPEVRGQGNDPIKERRGHIPNRTYWFRDLQTFTNLIRKKHPGVPIVWLGESMGSLIVLNTFAEQHRAHPQAGLPADALILSSPVVSLGDKLPFWLKWLSRLAVTFFPTAKISLSTLSGEENTQITADATYQEQVKNNPYHIDRFTLQLLDQLRQMIEAVEPQATAVKVPVLILHGGKDIFSKETEVQGFERAFTASPKVTRAYFPESHHLLFYDDGHENVIATLGKFLETLPRSDAD